MHKIDKIDNVLLLTILPQVSVVKVHFHLWKTPIMPIACTDVDIKQLI